MTNNDDVRETDNDNHDRWNGIYVGTLSLFVLSAAYVAIESSGAGFEIMMTSWDGAAASANPLVALMNDVAWDGWSSVRIIVGNGEVFIGEEAHWLMRELSELALFAMRSAEHLVLK